MEERVKSRYYPTATVGELETGVLFVQKIQRPQGSLPADYERWLNDPLKRPQWAVLHCSYKDCPSAAAYSRYEWLLKSYRAFFRGNTLDIQIGRALHDGWIYLRVWEQFYAFCPEHQTAWKELTPTEAIAWFIRFDAAGWLSSPARNLLIRRAYLYSAKRRDTLERRTTLKT